MSGLLQKEGIPFILGMIAGSGLKINGMYVEYGQPGQFSAGPRDAGYFAALGQGRKCGYTRVGVTHSDVVAGGVCFTSLVCPSDINNGKVNHGVCVVCVTLVCMKDDNPANDVFIYTADIPDSPVMNGASITVNVGMRLTGV